MIKIYFSASFANCNQDAQLSSGNMVQDKLVDIHEVLILNIQVLSLVLKYMLHERLKILSFSNIAFYFFVLVECC